MDKVYGRLKSRETDETVYYAQEFKIACADKKYCKVLEFLRTDEYRTRNIFLKDIDVTMDYSGSFDKDEVTEYLTTKKDCRIQGSVKDADRTILDNTDQVGNNCLTYMETVDGLTNIQNSRAFKTRIKEKQTCNRHNGCKFPTGSTPFKISSQKLPYNVHIRSFSFYVACQLLACVAGALFFGGFDVVKG